MALRWVSAAEYAIRVNQAAALSRHWSSADTVQASQVEFALQKCRAVRHVSAALTQLHGLPAPQRRTVLTVRSAPSFLGGLQECTDVSDQSGAVRPSRCVRPSRQLAGAVVARSLQISLTSDRHAGVRQASNSMVAPERGSIGLGRHGLRKPLTACRRFGVAAAPARTNVKLS